MDTRKTQLHKIVAGKKEVRNTLKHIWLDVEKKRVMATNGRALVIQPVENCENDTSGFITVDAWKAGLATCRTLPVTRIDCAVDSLKTIDGANRPRPEAGQFPDVDKCILSKDAKIKYEISFNARLLSNLSEALGSDIVRLQISEPDRMIKVLPAQSLDEKQTGYLMPCTGE